MKVIFACAGTGGHVNPAIAIANVLKRKEEDISILFIGTEKGLENQLVTNAGYEIKHIKTGKIIRSVTLKNIKALTENVKGIQEAKKMIKEFEPDLVIGTGGYICGPVMLAARHFHIPYLLHESNAFPGISTKLLAKRAKAVMIGFEDARKRLKNRKNIVYTGTPAKFDEVSFQRLDRMECQKKLQLKFPEKKIILVTCGSQGARKINTTILDMIKKYQNDNWYFILVTGENNYEEVLKRKKEIEEEIKVDLSLYMQIEKFIFHMDEMYKAVDMCITRAGAMTITELAISGKPSILIPLPTAAENHQLYNARVLESIGAAKMIEQKDLTEESLNKTIEQMCKEKTLSDMSKQCRKVIVKGVEENIYQCIKNSLKSR